MINVLLASIASSAVTSFFLAPFDMIFFKIMAKSTNLPHNASFIDVGKSVYIGRPGVYGALGAAFASTFIRYFFFYSGINCLSNYYQM